MSVCVRLVCVCFMVCVCVLVCVCVCVCVCASRCARLPFKNFKKIKKSPILNESLNPPINNAARRDKTRGFLV